MSGYDLNPFSTVAESPTQLSMVAISVVWSAVLKSALRLKKTRPEILSKFVPEQIVVLWSEHIKTVVYLQSTIFPNNMVE